MRRTILTAVLGLAGLALALGQGRPSDQEKEVRAAIDSYTAAFNKGDLDGVLAHFAADADFVDESGQAFRGKASLAGLFKQTLADLKGQQLKVVPTSIHFLRPDVAMVDGKADLTAPDGAVDSGRFTAVWSKTGGRWLLSSVHDLPTPPSAGESVVAPLQALEWLVG